MARHFGVPVLALSLFAPGTLSLAAQVTTGSILVRTVDEQGAVMPGVTVTAGSPVLVAGQITGTTDANGAWRFPSLPPGVYAVKVELQGFRTIIREDLRVVVGETTPVEIGMSVASVAETVTVRGESPVIDTTNANVNVHLDQKLLETTPGGRDIWSIVEYKVPGLVMGSPDVGGNQGGLQRSITARGTPNSQNTQMLNGVNVGDPAAIGFAGYYYDPSSFADIQVSSGAQDISVPSGGVFINMVTRTGTNRFQGSTLFTYQGDNTQSDNIDAALQQAGIRPSRRRPRTRISRRSWPTARTRSPVRTGFRAPSAVRSTTSRTAARATPTRRSPRGTSTTFLPCTRVSGTG